jgi:RNA polymerase sigma-70 factor, ECF subfamily
MNADLIAAEFEQQRPRLHAVAHRMLGSSTDADDAVQEAWLRLSRSNAGDIANLSGWLTTVVARVALDMLRARSRRREHGRLTQIDLVTDPAKLRRAGRTSRED